MSRFSAASRTSLRWVRIVTTTFVVVAVPVVVAAPEAPAFDKATLAAIREGAMSSDWAYQHLADLTDTVGPRLSGSPGAEAAVAQLAQAMRAAGARVTLQPCKVPHWVRGEETGEIVDWAGRAPDLQQKLHLTALGRSSATPAKGITASALVIHDFDELQVRAAEVRGRIVVYENHFDQRLADNGRAGAAYGQAGEYRFAGPARAAELGAAAVLVRSVGGAEYRLPHTGATSWKEGQAPIPAAALSAEDADLIDRLAARGPVSLHIVLTPKTLPDADSHNVIADLPGREFPDQVVIVSGHLDSWDLGTGAHDDGGPTLAAMGVVELLSRLHIQPRRTIRAIGWMNEENGGAGAKAYFESVKDRIGTQVAAIESDGGAGRPYGWLAALPQATRELLKPLMSAMTPLGASAIEYRDATQEVGADIGPLQAAGVPGFAPLVDTRHYFDLHHTAADTFDKVDPDALRRQVAVMALLAYELAEMPDALPNSQSPASTGAPAPK